MEDAFGPQGEFTLYETHLSVVVTLHTHQKPEMLCSLARRAGIACQRASGYGDAFPRLILGFSGISQEDIVPGIQALREIWAPFLTSAT